MSQDNGRLDLVDIVLYRRNRDKFLEEQLEPYWGKQVAFSGDGTRIVAAGDSHEDLDRRLRELGVDFGSVVFEYIDYPGEIHL
jgi:hypothetical protein